MAAKYQHHIETTDRELTITRMFDAPRTLVWKVWTQPEHVANWWGPNGFTNTIHEMEVKEGGVWRFIMHGPDGRDYPNKIVFLEVNEPERLVYQHDDDGSQENPIHFHVTVTFVDKGDDKTELTMRTTFDTAEGFERVVKEFGAREGAEQNITRLAEYLEKMHV